MGKRRYWSGFTPMSKFTQHTSCCEHAIWFFTELSEGLRLLLFWMVGKTNASRQEYWPPYRCIAFCRSSTVSEPSKLGELVFPPHTAMYWICGSTKVFWTSFWAAPCAKWPPFLHPCSSITPTLHHIVFTTPSFDFFQASSRSFVADQQMKGAHQKQFRCLFPTCTDRKSGKPPSDRGHKASEKVVRPLFDILNNTQNKEAHKWTEGTPSFWRKHNNVQTVTNVEGFRQATSNSKKKRKEP